MAQAYTAADLFVLPSYQDNFPNTALESQSCGIPAVAFAVGGIPEIVRNGVTGVTVHPGDIDLLAKAIEDLLNAPQKIAELSANCRRVAVTEYSSEVQAKRYLDLYESLFV